MDRLATFQRFIERSPADPFPRYGLAMEHRTRGDLASAAAAFADLMERCPDYVPTYLMAGGTFAALGRRDDALATYRRGVEVAGRRRDDHARSELERALAELEEAAG